MAFVLLRASIATLLARRGGDGRAQPRSRRIGDGDARSQQTIAVGEAPHGRGMSRSTRKRRPSRSDRDRASVERASGFRVDRIDPG
jgi:hypothetical protein